MPRRSLLLPLLAIGAALLFACILVRLLLLRYERGDVYPAYSTLRADPLGTRVFYEALEITGRHKVNRAFTSMRRELRKKPDALLYIGLQADQIYQFSNEEVTALDEYVRNGGRVIITLAPEAPGREEDLMPSSFSKKEKKKDPEKKPEPEKSSAEPDDDDHGTIQEKYERKLESEEQKAEEKLHPEREKVKLKYEPSLAAKWGFGLELYSVKKKEDDKGKKAHEDEEEKEEAKPDVLAWSSLYGSVEVSAPWKSALYFVRVEPDWQRLFYAKREPVMIRRHLGKGDILIATDSYFLSNEALRNERRPMLLNYLAGWPGSLLFDETHLGTEHQDGVMSLLNRFRLEGFVIGLGAVLLLFLWRNSLPLVPPQATDSQAPLGGTISGKDSRSALVNLLRRNIPAKEILAVCLREWKRDVLPSHRSLQAQTPDMDTVITLTQPNEIVEGYHHLRDLSSPRRKKESYATKS